MKGAFAVGEENCDEFSCVVEVQEPRLGDFVYVDYLFVEVEADQAV